VRTPPARRLRYAADTHRCSYQQVIRAGSRLNLPLPPPCRRGKGPGKVRERGVIYSMYPENLEKTQNVQAKNLDEGASGML